MQTSSRRILLSALVCGAAVGCGLLEFPRSASTELDYISGRVVSEGGSPEAGVWVIAQSDGVMPNDGRLVDFFRKIVVTGDDGRFVIPDLHDATYDVWVRGYGLVDSKSSWNRPGDVLVRPGARDVEITVRRAVTPQAAARIYPASYWYSLLELPPANAFPGDGSYIAAGMRTQHQWMAQLKLNCNLCHQMGNATTRLTSREAFDVGIKKVARMADGSTAMGHEALLDALGDWGERILAGEVPPSPPRPTGIERNVVITQWEIGDVYSYIHDTSAADRGAPDTNPYGLVYGTDVQADWLYILDPVRHTWTRKRIPIHPEARELRQEQFGLGSPAPDGHTTFAEAAAWSGARPHCPTIGPDNRVWLTTRSMGAYRPDFCPPNRPVHSLTAYDPKTGTFEVIPTCFNVHHAEFDIHGRVWSCGLGWLDPNVYGRDDPNSLKDAQGQVEFILDTTGDGVPDTEIPAGGYSLYPSPDGSVWNTQIGPSRINRYDPETGTLESYQPPYGHGPRGIGVDSEGVVWVALAGSGHLARFDRKTCARTWGLGDQCPEGWMLWKTPGPNFKGFVPDHPDDNANADQHYFIWVDRYNASGFGENTVIVNGTGSDSLILFDQETEAFTILRVPYPLGYYTRSSDARIDDPGAGWKGRGIWSSYNGGTQLFTETRRAAIVHMQIRPDPLAN